RRCSSPATRRRTSPTTRTGAFSRATCSSRALWAAPTSRSATGRRSWSPSAHWRTASRRKRSSIPGTAPRRRWAPSSLATHSSPSYAPREREVPGAARDARRPAVRPPLVAARRHDRGADSRLRLRPHPDAGIRGHWPLPAHVGRGLRRRAQGDVHLCRPGRSLPDEEARHKRATSPLRVFDIKNPEVRAGLEKAPKIGEALCDACREHFDAVRSHLDTYGIEYVLEPTLVRGLDYYTRTTFEFVGPDENVNSTICGGGRYDGLVEAVGGPATPGIGFGAGIERLLLAIEG